MNRAIQLTCGLSLLIGLLFTCVSKDQPIPEPPFFYQAVKEYNTQTGGVSLIINQGGETVLEDYANGGHPDSTWLLASGTKGFWGLVVAAAVQDGIISSLDENVSQTITEWQNDSRNQITLRQLLTLSSGLETQKGGPQPTVTYQQSLDLPLVTEPGSQYAYGPTPFQTFGEFMLRKLNGHDRPSAHQYLQTRLFDQLGIAVNQWWREADGHPRLASGAYLSARDWAILGDFVKDGGQWNGKQLLDTTTFKQIFEGTAANPAYGFGWWLNNPVPLTIINKQDDFVRNLMEFTTVGDQLPDDFFFALGGGNQRLYIIPSMDLVVVRQQKLPPQDGFEPFSDVKFLQLLLDLPEQPRISIRDQQKMNQFLTDVVDQQQLPLVAAAVLNKDKTLYSFQAGYTDETKSKPVDEQTIYGIRSMTKPITTVAILQLVEQGKMALDDPIGKYLPAYQSMQIVGELDAETGQYTLTGDTVSPTIRQLLTHTSGITYALFDEGAAHIFQENGGKGELPNWEGYPLMFEPGTKWHYGMSHRLAGWSLEVVTGQSLEAYCQAHIFEPLGMNDTHWILEEEQRARRATLFERQNEQWVPTKWPAAYGEAIRGDGGIYSTLADYSRFAQMLLSGGHLDGQVILSSASIETMSSNQIGDLKVNTVSSTAPFLAQAFPQPGGVDQFGLGVSIKGESASEVNTRSPGSYGWDGLLNTYFWIDPNTEIAVVFYTQSLPFYNEYVREILLGFEQLVYESITK